MYFTKLKMVSVNWGNAYVYSDQDTDRSSEGGGPNRWNALQPVRRRDIVSNDFQRTQIKDWFDSALHPGNDIISLLIIRSTTPGVGKTISVEIEASEREIRLARLDGSEPRPASTVLAAVRKSLSENVILFVDDAHRLAEETSGLAALVKSLKTNNRATSGNLRVVCCMDIIEEPRLSPLLGIANALIVDMLAIPVEEAAPYLRHFARRCDATLGYLDSILLAQRGNGDLRKMLVGLDLVLPYRTTHARVLAEAAQTSKAAVKAKRKRSAATRKSCAAASNILTVHVPLAYTGPNGTMILPNAASHEACRGVGTVLPKLYGGVFHEGISFARAFHTHTTENWISHSISIEGAAEIADALSISAIMLHPDEAELGAVEDASGCVIRPTGTHEVNPVACAASMFVASALVTGGRQSYERQRKIQILRSKVTFDTIK